MLMKAGSQHLHEGSRNPAEAKARSSRRLFRGLTTLHVNVDRIAGD